MNAHVTTWQIAEQLKTIKNYEISRKSLKYLGFMVSTQPTTQKPNFEVFFSEKLQKLSCKIFHRKTFCKDCLKKQIFISNPVQIPWFYVFLKILVFQKTHLLFKLIFRATQLQQRPIWFISKSIILHLNVKYKFGTKRCSGCGRAVFKKSFSFFLLKNYHFCSFNAFSKK